MTAGEFTCPRWLAVVGYPLIKFFAPVQRTQKSKALPDQQSGLDEVVDLGFPTLKWRI